MPFSIKVSHLLTGFEANDCCLETFKRQQAQGEIEICSSFFSSPVLSWLPCE